MKQRKPTKKDVLKAYDRLMRALAEVNNAQGDLARVASAYTGVDLIADVCSGCEVEFRTKDDKGEWDAFSCVRLDDIINDVP